MTSSLPDDLTRALQALSEGHSRHSLARRAAAISTNYRSGGTSSTITTADDALAYAFVRMPATFAAVAACLDALTKARADFSPASLIDVGAGPGTASWAAADTFASLQHFALADTNEHLRTLATTLMRKSQRLQRADYRGGSARAFLNGAGEADLVIASYMIGEIAPDERGALAALMWQRTRDVLLIVEPGTPDGYERIIALRGHLIALGAHTVAPCPHDRECPLSTAHVPEKWEPVFRTGHAPEQRDWCHFSRRLPRSRDHKLLKDAEVPFEDEKFSYVALSRTPPARRAARVLARPSQSKAAITAKLCMEGGVSAVTIPRRDKNAFAGARRWRWGDAVDPDHPPQGEEDA